MKLENVVAAIEQLGDISGELISDITSSRDEVINNDSPFWRRTLVRSLFAGIEGISYRLKQVSVTVAEYNSVDISNAEKALLAEESYDLNDKGEATIKKAKLRTAENLLFSIKIAAQAAKNTYEIDKSSAGWSAFKEALKIRDRITHPKNAQDLNVSDNELEIVNRAISWFGACYKDIITILHDSI